MSTDWWLCQNFSDWLRLITNGSLWRPACTANFSFFCQFPNINWRSHATFYTTFPRACMQNQHSYVILRSGATKNLYLSPNSPDVGQNETLRLPLHFVQGFGSGWHKFNLHTHSSNYTDWCQSLRWRGNMSARVGVHACASRWHRRSCRKSAVDVVLTPNRIT